MYKKKAIKPYKNPCFGPVIPTFFVLPQVTQCSAHRYSL